MKIKILIITLLLITLPLMFTGCEGKKETEQRGTSKPQVESETKKPPSPKTGQAPGVEKAPEAEQKKAE